MKKKIEEASAAAALGQTPISTSVSGRSSRYRGLGLSWGEISKVSGERYGFGKIWIYLKNKLVMEYSCIWERWLRRILPFSTVKKLVTPQAVTRRESTLFPEVWSGQGRMSSPFD